MIQPNEIKLNNIVKYNGEALVLDEDRLEVLFGSRNYDDYEPIPITPSILSACGFTPLSDPEFTHHHPELNILFDGEFFWLKEGKITHYLSKCEYLHKLQNGVFWVTGKELIVNIEKVKV